MVGRLRKTTGEGANGGEWGGGVGGGVWGGGAFLRCEWPKILMRLLAR